jgi:hypothetical protein
VKTNDLVSTGEIELENPIQIMEEYWPSDPDLAVRRFQVIRINTLIHNRFINFIFMPLFESEGGGEFADTFSLIRGQWDSQENKWMTVDWFEKHDVSGLMFAYALGLLKKEP